MLIDLNLNADLNAPVAFLFFPVWEKHEKKIENPAFCCGFAADSMFNTGRFLFPKSAPFHLTPLTSSTVWKNWKEMKDKRLIYSPQLMDVCSTFGEKLENQSFYQFKQKIKETPSRPSGPFVHFLSAQWDFSDPSLLLPNNNYVSAGCLFISSQFFKDMKHKKMKHSNMSCSVYLVHLPAASIMQTIQLFLSEIHAAASFLMSAF